ASAREAERRSVQTIRTDVGIVGAGPAGLLLAHLLHQHGIESVVLESRSRDHVEHRVRAGVIEHGTANLLEDCGVGERMRREGLVHTGVELLFDRTRHRIPLSDLAGGRSIVVYGQQEVVKDLIAARLAAGGTLLFDSEATGLEDISGERPAIRFVAGGEEGRLECEVIAGCDGFHGISRHAPPPGALQLHTRDHPFGWLGVLAAAAPANEELVYCRSEHGFALLSMRTPQISRLYLQVAPDEPLADWPDERIWAELARRLVTDDGWTVTPGPVLEKGVTAMRSCVVEPMRYGSLYLCGDAAHIVPPTGAKGMNLAIADVALLAEALAARFHKGDERLLEGWSDSCLRRVWRAQEFSTYLTTMLHVRRDDEFDTRLQEARLRYLVDSPAAATSMAERYVDLSSMR
ncbi:MAG TPA: 4-hydroxybenzoate 3-monooxygenase, partial [Acidimicrobiales bacterium]|nr:4-hydroxybenzoate 3-monooxygenase [Acidimicrobiales bacterium]